MTPALGPRLRALREAAGLTLAEVAYKMGRPRELLREIEADEESQTVRLVARYAAACGYEVEIVFKRREG